MKRITLLATVMLGLSLVPAKAQTGFYLPNGVASYGQDEFRAADGTTCRSTMDGTRRVEVGAFAAGGEASTYTGSYSLPRYSQPSQGNAGVYGRFSMSLDASPDRMDCAAMFRLELEKRRLEVELMKRSLTSADQRLDEQVGAEGATGSIPEEPVAEAAPAAKPAVTGKKAAAKAPAKLAAAKRQSPPP